MAYNYWELSSEEFRDIIEGKIHFRKCSSCGGFGFDYYNNDTGEFVDRYNEELLQELHSEFCLSTDSCDVCRGLGYIESYRE